MTTFHIKPPTGSRHYKRKKGKKLLKDGTLPESVIQGEILNWLETTGLLYWRQNAGYTFAAGRRIYLGPDGISDIVVVLPPNGRFVGLEVKSANGSIRPDQKLFANKIQKSGGAYHIVRTLEQAKAAVLKELCVPDDGDSVEYEKYLRLRRAIVGFGTTILQGTA